MKLGPLYIMKGATAYEFQVGRLYLRINQWRFKGWGSLIWCGEHADGSDNWTFIFDSAVGGVVWNGIADRVAAMKRRFNVIYHANHNSRVIRDFETRMLAVIYQATDGQMSHAYYGAEDMVRVIDETREKVYAEGFTDGQAQEKARQNAIRRGKGRKK